MVRRHVSRRAGLTLPLTSLIGREREIHELTARILDDDIRLVTLTGPGGIGKTRLALAVADLLRDPFEDEVWVVPLASISGHSLVIPTIAHRLGIDEQPDQPILERLISQLQERQVLLVLDNVEHIVAAGPDIAHLLGACPGVQVLATGREPLRLHGERLYPVLPLELPAIDDPGAAKKARESDAVRLFTTRVNEVDPGFCLTEQNTPAVVEICRRLDGLPLALELAAARINLLTPDDLLARLGEPLAVLTGGPRDAPARQQTMRATLQWSYDLLTADEQRLLRQMAVFSGGCTLDAIEAVAAPDPVLETLSSLVDKSLIRRVEPPGQPTRYGLLEPVRQFAMELLMENDCEATDARQRHACYFLSLVDELRRRLDGPEGLVWFVRIETEHNNLRSVLNWLVECNQIESGLRLFGDLGMFWVQRHLFEGKGFAELLFSHPEASHRTIGRSKALWAYCWLLITEVDYEPVLQLITESCDIAAELGDQLNFAHALFTHGIYCLNHDRAEQAETDFTTTLAISRELEIDEMTVRSLVHLGSLARAEGDLDRDRDLHEEALTIARNSNLPIATALALGALGETMELQGERKQAADLYHKQLVIYLELNIPKGIADSLIHIARLLRQQERLKSAVCLLGAASILHERSGSRFPDAIAGRPKPAEELHHLRQVMTRQAFQTAWERGRSIPIEKVISIAMLPVVSASERLAGLTAREVEVLQQVTQGLTNAQIAEQLFISPRTVSQHLRNIYNKLGVSNRTEATRFAVENGLT